MGKVLCELCRKKCKGDVFRISEKYFHKDCFRCKICKVKLESRGFFMRDGNFYCQKDYNLYFSTKCKVCRKDLDNEVISALNALFHKECFRCESCQNVLKPGDQVSCISHRYYCNKCAKNAQKTSMEALKSKKSFFSKEALKSKFFRSSTRDRSPDHAQAKELLRIDPNIGSDQENVSPSTYPMLRHEPIEYSKTLDSSNSLHLYQSYLHLNECRARNPNDLYKRIPSLGTLPSEFAYRPKQFHIPENRLMRSRYASSMGPSYNSLHTMKTSTPREMSRASTRHYKHNLSTSTMPLPTNGAASPTSYDLTEEVRRLALYPDGHCRPESSPAPIERLDWPAPASTGVVMAEMMRERKRRKNASLKSSDYLDHESDLDADSHDALSIDASLNSSTTAMHESLHHDRSRSKSRHKKCKSVNLDLISASRSPSARFEPPYRTRFTDHAYVSPSRDTSLLRDHLNDSGRLTYSLDYVSQPYHRSATLLTNGSFAFFDSGSRQMPALSNRMDRSRTYQSARFPLHSIMKSSHSGTVDLFPDSAASSRGTSPSLDENTATLTRNGQAKTSAKAPQKVFAYEVLRLTNDKIPAGLDRAHLEKHLSDTQFEMLFRMSRRAFSYLPEWRRNDMKRRVNLF